MTPPCGFDHFGNWGGTGIWRLKLSERRNGGMVNFEGGRCTLSFQRGYSQPRGIDQRKCANVECLFSADGDRDSS